jgi:hypothetical protein
MEGMGWIDLAKNMYRGRDLVNEVMNHKMWGIS